MCKKVDKESSRSLRVSHESCETQLTRIFYLNAFETKLLSKRRALCSTSKTQDLLPIIPYLLKIFPHRVSFIRNVHNFFYSGEGHYVTLNGMLKVTSYMKFIRSVALCVVKCGIEYKCILMHWTPASLVVCEVRHKNNLNTSITSSIEVPWSRVDHVPLYSQVSPATRMSQ